MYGSVYISITTNDSDSASNSTYYVFDGGYLRLTNSTKKYHNGAFIYDYRGQYDFEQNPVMLCFLFKLQFHIFG